MKEGVKAAFRLSVRVIAITIVTILLLEGGVRIVLYCSLNNYFTKILPQPYGRIMQKTGQFVCFGVGAANRFDPICYYVRKQGFFRGPHGPMDWPKEKEAREIRIICIGDSTTFGVAVNYYHTWVYLLGKTLTAKYPGKKIQMLNAGLPGASSRQIKRIFQVYLTSYHPDILIWRGGSDLTDTYSISHTTSDLIRFFVWRCLYESRVFRVICVLWDETGKYKMNSTVQTMYNFLTSRFSRGYEKGFESDFNIVKKIAEEHGTRYALQVEYLLRNGKGVISSDLVESSKPAVHTLAVFQDYERRNPSKALFVDSVHLTEIGEAITARETSEFIIAHKWIESFN